MPMFSSPFLKDLIGVMHRMLLSTGKFFVLI